ncbi:MAG: ACT domain-containing protein [Phycisphaerae bacterium]
MAVKVSRVNVWAAGMEDRPGALAEKLDALSQAGANLEFVIARRTHAGEKGGGVVFVAPLKGARQSAAAKKAGFKKADSMHSLRVEAPDKPGLGSKITAALAELDINLRGVSAAAVGKKSVCYLAFDSAKDAQRASRKLRNMR